MIDLTLNKNKILKIAMSKKGSVRLELMKLFLNGIKDQKRELNKEIFQTERIIHTLEKREGKKL